MHFATAKMCPHKNNSLFQDNNDFLLLLLLMERVNSIQFICLIGTCQQSIWKGTRMNIVFATGNFQENKAQKGSRFFFYQSNALPIFSTQQFKRLRIHPGIAQKITLLFSFLGSITNIDDDAVKCKDGSSPEIRNKVISGVVGAASSVTSIQVANLLRLFKIPQVFMKRELGRRMNVNIFKFTDLILQYKSGAIQ